MANLRANNLTGTGGRNAITGSVYFDENSYLEVTNPSDLALGDGDFTIETWVNFAKIDTYQCIIDFRGSGNGAFPFIVRDTDGDLYYYVNSGKLIDNVPARANNCWHHIAVVRNSGTTKFYLNGVEEGSASDSTTYLASNNPTIGASISLSNDFFGYLSNLRIVKGTAVYTAAFTPPTEKLTAIEGTVLLCCHDMDDPTAEATGKEIVGFRKCYHGKRYSNIATNGDLETGTTTNWTNGGCSTFELSNFSNSGSYSIHAVTDGNGDAIVYTIPVTLKVGLRYKISAYINCVGPVGTSAKAKMKIGAGTGGNENYESQTADTGAGWVYVEWIGLATSDTTHVTFNESSSNNVNDYYVDDLKIELWYPEEGVNILPNPDFLTGATGWSFSSTPSGEYTISSNRLNVTDTSRTNDAFATVQLFANAYKEGKYKVTIDYVLTSDDFDIGIGNNRIFGVAGGGTYSGEGNSASVTYEIDAGSTNSNLRIVANQHCVGYFNNITLSRVAEPKRNNPLPPVGVDAGVTFEGDTKVNTQSYMYFPTGDTSQRGRGRAVISRGMEAPGSTLVKTMQYIEIQSMGNSIDFGDGTDESYGSTAVSSSTRGITALGATANSSPYSIVNTLDYVTLATTANATDFGDLVVAAMHRTGMSNNTRGVIAAGFSPNTRVMDLITIATTGDATDFGDSIGGRYGMNQGGQAGSSTRGLLAGGDSNSTPFEVNKIQYITFATASDTQDFGDLNDNDGYFNMGASSDTRAVFAGGDDLDSPYPTTNRIDYVTIATLGNATDFGDLMASTYTGTGHSNGIRGVFSGGLTIASPAANVYLNTIQYITIATTGNASDFGDTSLDRVRQAAGMSDSHGGLS